MLRDLHVRNLAVLSEAEVGFGPGLNVLSGETGAGKSLVVDSLALLAGARASTELIRGGAEQLTVTGVFEPRGAEWRQALAEAGVEAQEEELVIRREISRAGRNRIFVDDQPVTLRLLSSLAPGLLRIHVQREELGLASPELQRRWLDRSAGAEAEALLERTGRAFHAYRALAERLEKATGDERLRLERIDLLRFQAGEIDAAKLKDGEDVELRREREVLHHGEAITTALGSSLEMLLDEEGAATERLSRGRKLLQEIARWEPEAGDWAAELDDLRIRAEELARGLRARLERVEADPARLDALEERLAAIERLCRKYGDTAAEVLAHRQRIGRELQDLAADDEQRAELRERVEEALSSYRDAALELSRARRRWSAELTGRVHAELAELAMRKARFAVRLGHRARADSPFEVEGRPVEIGAAGIDAVGFELAANPGEEMKPLSRVASGGELSRVYLALQLAVRGERGADDPTLVFDEVDAGIGGAVAAALGQKLQRLSRAGQILVVTHLPQVASFADRHFKVEKRVARGRTHMRVEALDEDGRVQEVARMLAGKRVTDLSRSHAEELIEVAGRGRK